MTALQQRVRLAGVPWLRRGARLGKRAIARRPERLSDVLGRAATAVDRSIGSLDRIESRSWYDQGTARLRAGRETEALECLLRAAEVGPQLWATVQRLNDHHTLYALAGRDDVLDRMRGMAARAPNAWRVQLQVGAFLLDQGHLDEGREVLRRGYRLQLERRGIADAPTSAASPAAPAFLIIGPHKSGTTSLHEWISLHPDVVEPPRKELQFWPNRRGRPLAFYDAYFPPLPPGSRLITGEASASYLRSPTAASDIARRFPHVRVIILQRDPVERAFSHYQMLHREGFEQRSFSETVDDELRELGIQPPLDLSEIPVPPDGSHEERHPPAYGGRNPLLLGSAVLPFVKMWTQLLGADRVMVVDLEALSLEPDASLETVFEYLGLSQAPVEGLDPRNVAAYEGIPTDVRDRLRAWFEPHESALSAYLDAHPTRVVAR